MWLFGIDTEYHGTARFGIGHLSGTGINSCEAEGPPGSELFDWSSKPRTETLWRFRIKLVTNFILSKVQPALVLQSRSRWSRNYFDDPEQKLSVLVLCDLGVLWLQSWETILITSVQIRILKNKIERKNTFKKLKLFSFFQNYIFYFNLC